MPNSLIDAFVAARALADGQSSTANQAVVAEFMAAGHFARHIRRMRSLYAERQEVLLRAVDRELGGHIEIDPSNAGMHLIGWLNEGVNDWEVVKNARRHGLVMTPLSILALGRQRRGGLLLGYTAINPRSIRDGIRKLAQVLSQKMMPLRPDAQ